MTNNKKMHYIIKKQLAYLQSIPEKKNKKICQKITLGLSKHQLIILSGIRGIPILQIVKEWLNNNDIQQGYFYYNHLLDIQHEITSGKDLKNLFSGYINIYKSPKIIILENINKIPEIKDFIIYAYKQGYKIIIIGNSFQIEGKPEIEILPENTSGEILYGSFSHIISLESDIHKIDLLHHTLSDIILHSIVSHFSIKNIDMYMGTMLYISKLKDYTSLRQIHKGLNQYGDISLKTLIDYIDFSLQAKLIRKMYKYDLKTNKPITSAIKYYFTDTGLRNVCSQQECDRNILQENFLYLDLIKKGYQVYGGKNGVFEMSFYIHNEMKGGEYIYIHICEQTDISEVKKEVRKLQKIDGIGTRYLVVENEEMMRGKKRVYGDVEIVGIEECMDKLDI